MNKYIEVNNSDITDVFFDWQKEKMKSSTKILLEENVSELKHKVNGKSISEELGCYIFTYISGSITEKTTTEIEQSDEYIQKYKSLKKENLKNIIDKDSITDGITRTIPEIKTRWRLFKNNASSWTSKQDIDDAYDQAIAWLYS